MWPRATAKNANEPRGSSARPAQPKGQLVVCLRLLVEVRVVLEGLTLWHVARPWSSKPVTLQETGGPGAPQRQRSHRGRGRAGPTRCHSSEGDAQSLGTGKARREPAFSKGEPVGTIVITTKIGPMGKTKG